MVLSKDPKDQRKQVWTEAWIRTAQSNSCTKIGVATAYADACLAEFDKRFPIEESKEAIDT